MSDDRFTNPPLGLPPRPGPQPKPTVAVESPPAWAIAMAENINRISVNVDGNHRVVMHALDGLTGRVVVLEKHKADAEERARKHSGGIQKVSVNDASQDAAIASLVTDMAIVKPTVESMQVTQTKVLSILERLDKVAANPIVRRIAYGVGTLVLGYLASRGIR